MKKVSGNFRNSLRGIRELTLNVSFLDNDLHDVLKTESNLSILTENGKELYTESSINNLNEEQAKELTINNYAQLGKSTMKYIEVKSKTKMPIKKYPNAKIGVKVDEDYEFLDYGNYEVTECKYELDTKLYSILAYDRMIKSMIKYDEQPLKITYPISHRDLLVAICGFLGFKYQIPEMYPNSSKMLKKDLYSGNDMTYRDILDDLNTVIGPACFQFTTDDVFTIKFLSNDKKNSTLLPFTIGNDAIINQDLGENIDENQNVVNDYDMKTDNVDISVKVGPINQVVYTDKDNVSRVLGQDDKSIQENGLNTYEIKDCKILDEDINGEFSQELFDKLNGLEYYVYDLQTKGILNLETLDRFYAFHDDTYYSCVLFNSTINVANGLGEQIYTDEPEEQQQEYTTSQPTSKAVKNAVIQANKNAGTIVLKVTSDNKMAQVRLDASADEGTEFNVSADSIDFQSHTFNLATDDISIISDNVAITNNGIQLSNGATIAGENGLITNLFFTSGGSMGGYQKLGFSTDMEQLVNQNVFLDVYIPQEFTIIGAYLTLQHCSVDWFGGTDTPVSGYARNIRIYKATGSYRADNSLGELVISQANLEEIPNALGVAEWTPTTLDMQYVTGTTDLKNYLKHGMNTIVAKSNASDPTSIVEVGEKTGVGKLTLNVIGYMPYER